jgi:hypothetical protein
MYSSYIVDTSFGNVALSYSTPFATVGAGILYLEHKEIQGYDEGANAKGSYKAEDLCAIFSLSKEIVEDLSIGASAKYIQSKIEEESAQGFCFNAGALFCTPYARVGIVFAKSRRGSYICKEEESASCHCKV